MEIKKEKDDKSKNLFKSYDFGKVFNLSKIKEWFKGGKGIRIIFVLGIAGIVLIGLSSLLKGKEDNGSTPLYPSKDSAFSIDDYVLKLEDEVLKLVESVEGAGKAKVMITLESGIQYVYASEIKNNTDKQENTSGSSQRDDLQKSVVIVDREDGKQGLLITEIQPKIKGVVVLCEGGDIPLTNERVTDIVKTLLNISTRKVCVAKLK